GAPPLFLTRLLGLLAVEVVRNVIEGRAERRTDVLHRGNRGNGDQGGNQAVLDRGGTLFVANQLKKLAHGLRSLAPSAEEVPRPCQSTAQDAGKLSVDPLGKRYER